MLPYPQLTGRKADVVAGGIDFPASASLHTRSSKCHCLLVLSLGPLTQAKTEYRSASHPLGCRMFGDKRHLAVSSGCPLNVGNNEQWRGRNLFLAQAKR